jgi:putative phosphoesterase
MTQVGVVSDTHGLLRPEVIETFQGVDVILHAGDIGDPEILANLKAIAPVFAIRGNNDTGLWADKLPESRILSIEGIRIFMIHDVKAMEKSPSRCQAVVAGHSHRPSVETREGVLFLNPGSAGPRRFNLPISVALVTVRGTSVGAKLIKV